MLEWFSKLSFIEFLFLLTVANLLMYLGSWALVSAIQSVFRAQILNKADAKPTQREYVLSLFIVLINISVGVPGWILWKAHRIELTNNNIGFLFFDILLLLIYFDFSMYALHRLMHQGPLYRFIHSKHHDHVNVNGISFYVMNPAESLGFGALLIGFLLVHLTNFYALLFYLTLNWAYGTMGHSGVPVRSRLLLWLVGDTEFHHRHHTGKNGNYGFYTPIWDRLFGTTV
jgi:lathosterol oxidase